jgi:hypothetical protein
MKIYTMVRDCPEAEGQPTKLHVPECDVDVLKLRGWTVAEDKTAKVQEEKKEEKVEKPAEPAVEETTEETVEETVSGRGRRRNH